MKLRHKRKQQNLVRLCSSLRRSMAKEFKKNVVINASTAIDFRILYSTEQQTKIKAIIAKMKNIQLRIKR